MNAVSSLVCVVLKLALMPKYHEATFILSSPFTNAHRYPSRCFLAQIACEHG